MKIVRHRFGQPAFRGAKFISLLLLVLLGALSWARAEESAEAGSPERVIRDFYSWYVHGLVNNRDPFKGERTELKRFATTRLINEIDKARKGPDGLDGDYFLDAQDFDKEWAKNITVSNAVIRNGRATVEVELKGSEVGTRNLLVDLAWERGSWKVDKVQSQ